MTLTFPTYSLVEWDDRYVPGVILTASDRRLLEDLKGQSSVRIEIRELRDGIRIKSSSWVGIIQFQNFIIRIEPKLAGENAGLVGMLSLTQGLDALRRNPSQRRLKVEESVHLLDLIALLFAEACEQVLERGLLQDYVERESDLPVLRGRLLVNQQIRRHYGRVERLACRHDDHLTDILENQILTAALAICRSRVHHPAVRLQIHRLHTIFSSACLEDELFDLKEMRAKLFYHRMNEYYQEAHELAWLLFDCMGINDLLALGRTRSFAFLLDMNSLFERFVIHVVEHALRLTKYRVIPKRRDRTIIWDMIQNRPYTHIEPDILIESRVGHRLTLDAKYKLYDEKRLSTADIYQSFFYAYTYNDSLEQNPTALILYPSSSQSKPSGYLQIRDRDYRERARLQTLSIQIPQAIEEITENKIGPVSRLILEAVETSIEDKGSRII